MKMYEGFSVFSPVTTSGYVLDEFRRLAGLKGGGAKYRAVLEIKQGTSADKAVEDYMFVRGLGTDDADKLKQHFSDLAERTGESEIMRQIDWYNKRARNKMYVIYGV